MRSDIGQLVGIWSMEIVRVRIYCVVMRVVDHLEVIKLNIITTNNLT